MKLSQCLACLANVSKVLVLKCTFEITKKPKKETTAFWFNSTTANCKNDCFFIINQALNVILMRQEMFDVKNYTFGRTSKIDVRPVTSVDMCIDFIGYHLRWAVLPTLSDPISI